MKKIWYYIAGVMTILVACYGLLNGSLADSVGDRWLELLQRTRTDRHVPDPNLVIVYISPDTTHGELGKIFDLLVRSEPAMIVLFRSPRSTAADRSVMTISDPASAGPDGGPVMILGTPLSGIGGNPKRAIFEAPGYWRPDRYWYSPVPAGSIPAGTLQGAETITLENNSLPTKYYCPSVLSGDVGGTLDRELDVGVVAARLILAPRGDTSLSIDRSGLNMAGRKIPILDDGRAIINHYNYRYDDNELFPRRFTTVDFYVDACRSRGTIEVPNAGSREIAEYASDCASGGFLRHPADAGEKGSGVPVDAIPELRDKVLLLCVVRENTVNLLPLSVSYATIIQNIIDDDFIYPVSRAWQYLITLVMALFAGIVLFRFQCWKASYVIFLAIVSCLLITIGVYSYLNVFLTPIPTLAPGLLSLAVFLPFEILREREIIRAQPGRIGRDIRQQIASDLHDEIGAQLTRMTITSDIAGMELTRLLNNQRLTKEEMEKVISTIREIAQDSRTTVSLLSDVVWAINPSSDSFEDFTFRMQEYMTRYLKPHGIVPRYAVSSGFKADYLTLHQKKHLFMILKEALTNIVKHSGATGVELSLERTPDSMILAIRDNGRGLPLFNGQPDAGGNGLNNMKARAEALNGELTVDSLPGGTMVTLRMKISEQ